MKQCPSCGRKNYGNEKYCPICQCYLGNVKEESNVTSYNKSKQVPIIECPYCHGTNTVKISTTSKATNTVLFGVFGTKRYKQWHCNSCGSDF